MINIIVLSLAGLGVLFGLIRLIAGPTAFDRVLSLDVINIIITGIIVLLAHMYENSLYLDIAIIYAILSFLETVVFARFLEGRD